MVGIEWETASIQVDGNHDLATLVRLMAELDRNAGAIGDEPALVVSRSGLLRVTGRSRVDRATELLAKLQATGWLEDWEAIAESEQWRICPSKQMREALPIFDRDELHAAGLI